MAKTSKARTRRARERTELQDNPLVRANGKGNFMGKEKGKGNSKGKGKEKNKDKSTLF